MTMVCDDCGRIGIRWMGPLSNLTHTECPHCGGRNCQRADDYDDYDDYDDGLDHALQAVLSEALAAQGGEARQGGDACGSVHEHPVAEGHAPNSCPSHPINTQGESA